MFSRRKSFLSKRVVKKPRELVNLFIVKTRKGEKTFLYRGAKL